MGNGMYCKKIKFFKPDHSSASKSLPKILEPLLSQQKILTKIKTELQNGLNPDSAVQFLTGFELNKILLSDSNGLDIPALIKLLKVENIEQIIDISNKIYTSICKQEIKLKKNDEKYNSLLRLIENMKLVLDEQLPKITQIDIFNLQYKTIPLKYLEITIEVYQIILSYLSGNLINEENVWWNKEKYGDNLQFYDSRFIDLAGKIRYEVDYLESMKIKNHQKTRRNNTGYGIKKTIITKNTTEIKDASENILKENEEMKKFVNSYLGCLCDVSCEKFNEVILILSEKNENIDEDCEEKRGHRLPENAAFKKKPLPQKSARGITLFERINRLSVMRDLIQTSKVVDLEIFDRISLKKEQKQKENTLIKDQPKQNGLSSPVHHESYKNEDSLGPKIKISPPEENLKEEIINMQDLNEHYDLGNQNYFMNKMRKSLLKNDENSRSPKNDENSKYKEKSLKIEENSKNDENSKNLEEIDLDFTIQTRKRKRSLVYSRHGINELVILSSRNETAINKEGFSFPKAPTSITTTIEALKPKNSRILYDFFCELRLKISIFFQTFSKKLEKIQKDCLSSFTKVLTAKEDLREIDLSTQKSQYVLLPTSFFQRNWDLLILLCIFSEFLLIPLKISFSLDKNSIFLTFLDCLVLLASVLDILLNFKTAYLNSRGVLELNPRNISLRYRKYFLFFDLCATFPLNLAFQIYILTNPESSEIFNETRESSDYFRLILLYKILRFSRLSRILSRFDENTLYNPAIVRITKSTIGLMFLWHWIACFYWFIAISEGFSQNSWTPDPAFLYKAAVSQYNYSLLWAVTVTVGIGVNIAPHTNLELIYSSLVIVIGVALYGILLGSTSSAFLSIDDQDADLRKQLDSLNNFMRKKKVSFDLQKRIEENLKYLWSSQQTLNVSNQWFLEGVHSLLKLELCIHLNKQYLDKIPMFKNISFDCLVFLLNLLESRIYLPEEFVICEGSYSQNLYFIQTGILEVIDKRNSTRVRLYDGDFFGEQSLFVLKKKTTDVKCLSYSELLIISKNALAEIIKKFPDFAINLFNYLKNKDQMKNGAKNNAKGYWVVAAHAYEIAKFLKREDPAIYFEDLFVQKKKEGEEKEEIKKKVVDAFQMK